jgi:hypothetical protein
MSELITTIGKWWLTWVLGLIGTGIIAGFRVLYKRQKAAEIRQTALESGVQAILRDRILTSYYHYHEKGKITLHGLENVEAMYRSYHDLGGNGTMTHLVEVMREMEVIDE